MRFVLIDPAARSWQMADHPTLDEALRAVGLKPGQVDFGSLGMGISIVVDEFGLFADPAKTSYFALGRGLYAGNAVIFAASPHDGETIDVPLELMDGGPTPRWLTAEGVEAAIQAGKIRRPQHTINNGPPTWQWPQPAPAGFPARAGRASK